MNDQIEASIARLVRDEGLTPAKQGHATYGRRPQIEEPDRLVEIALLLRSLPAEELWKMCDKMKRPELDKVLVNWAISHIDGGDFVEPKGGANGTP